MSIYRGSVSTSMYLNSEKKQDERQENEKEEIKEIMNKYKLGNKEVI